MAERPTKMVERVRDIEAQALRLAFGLLMAVPVKYRAKNPDMNDPLAVAWIVAVDNMTKASKALETLGNLLGEAEQAENAEVGEKIALCSPM